MNKICSMCRIEKDISAFGYNGVTKNTVRTSCKVCEVANKKKQASTPRGVIRTWYKALRVRERKIHNLIKDSAVLDNGNVLAYGE